MFYGRVVSASQPDYHIIKELYCRAFPASERYPLWLLLAMSLRKCVYFIAFYDDGVFCGFTYLIQHGKLTFVLYLAVDGGMRSRGYGGCALDWIKKRYPANDIVLNIEAIEPSQNYSQRVKRLEFYEKNGFHRTGYFSTNRKGKLLTLFYGRRFDPGEYERLVLNYSFGLVGDRVSRSPIG